MNILITSGATREPIDKVRFISNMSSGKTGATLANELSKLNHKVTYLHGEGAALPAVKTENIAFNSFQDLDEKIKKLMQQNPFDVVVHLAAVSDYSVEKVLQNGKEVISDSKLPSDGELEFKLRPNHKILNRIKEYAGSHEPMVIGFKLTYSNDQKLQEEAVEKLFNDGAVDLVVHNDLHQIESTSEHQFRVHNIFKKLETVKGAEALAHRLNSIIEEVL